MDKFALVYNSPLELIDPAVHKDTWAHWVFQEHHTAEDTADPDKGCKGPVKERVIKRQGLSTRIKIKYIKELQGKS